MINCKNCGAPLTLDDAYCPHCDTPNQEAIDHIKQLEEIKKDYKETKAEVISEAKKSYRGYNLLIILVFLLLANIIIFFLYNSTYDISQAIINKRQNKDTIVENINKYLQDENYLELVTYTDKYYISYKDYEEYMPIIYLAYDYKQIVRDVSNYYSIVDNYTDPLTDACRDIVTYNDTYKSYTKHDRYSEFTKNNLDKINQQYREFIKNNLYLAEEDLSEIENMNSSEIVNLVIERIKNEKEN